MKDKVASLYRTLFGNSARAFGTVSVILLFSLAIAPAKDYFSEWRHYQNQYRKLVRGRAEGATLEKHLEPGIQQIWIPEQGIVDRCTTCHVGLHEASLADVSQQPFTKHPEIPHKLTEFGCVTCHRGQGPATTVEEAHSSTKSWEQPILPAKYIESGCGQCHLSPLTGTPQLNLGRSLIAHSGCTHCHNVKLPDGTKLQPTDDPPSLTHIADKTTREWIYAWVKDPQSYSSTATMPKFGFGDDQLRDVSAFLIAQSTPSPALQKPAIRAKAATDPVAGASLYGESFCASCHAVQNAAGTLVGGDFGPELTKIGTKAKPQWIAAWLRDPPDYDPATKMPHYRFNDQQIATLSGFLQAKTDSDFLANVHLTDATPEQIANGKQIVTEYGCASCHEINGVKKPENFAPDLSRIGSKPLVQIAFAEGVQHTLPDYLAAKVQKPRAFGASLKMPKFTFTPQQIDAVTTALLTLTDRAQTQPATLRIASHIESNYQPAGKAGQLMNDLRCFSCHSINGRGGDMAPDLTWEGSSVQRSWLQGFLKNPNTLRPALIRRMPRFNLTDAEINTLTDYIMTVYQTPAFERDSIPPSEFTPAMAEQGKELFYGKYACQSCHIVDQKTDKGYIGPALWSVGSRLTPAWIYHYLKNPQAIRPGTLEPNQQMSDNDARLLTAYMVSLKSGGKQVAKK
jgi:mono/diheme cytochrome c family protein